MAAASEEKKTAALLEALRKDPKLRSVVTDYESALEGARKFGSNGLKADNKLFALFTQGTLVVKLPKDRVVELVAKKVGAPFDPGHGRLMKEWLTITNARANWLDLAREAHAFVSKQPRRGW